MKTTLVVGVVVAIVVLVGVLAIFLGVGKHSVTTSSSTLPPVSLPSTSTTTTTTNQSQSSTTTSQSTVTSTTTQPNKIKPDYLYLLNYSNGTYWYVAVFNYTLPNVIGADFLGYNVKVYTYHLYGYTELLIPSKRPAPTGYFAFIAGFSNGDSEFLGVYNFGYNWTYGNL